MKTQGSLVACGDRLALDKPSIIVIEAELFLTLNEDYRSLGGVGMSEAIVERKPAINSPVVSGVVGGSRKTVRSH